MGKTPAPFGSWPSPITTEILFKNGAIFTEMQATCRALYWTEMRPEEKGRVALVEYREKERPLMQDKSIRSRVHEYGGGALLAKDEDVIVVNDADEQLYSLRSGQPLTSEKNTRFADGSGSFWVGEKHNNQVENSIVFIDDLGNVHTVAKGHDFYSSPRLSPDGTKLAFITWDHPNMQWNTSSLWLAQVDPKGHLHRLRCIAGGKEESICQLQWSPKGLLHFVSDKTGFWNLYSFHKGECKSLFPMDAEFAYPPWVFGRPSYAFANEHTLYCAHTIKGKDYLGILDKQTETFNQLHLPFTLIQNLTHLNDHLYFFGASTHIPLSIIALDLQTHKWSILKQSVTLPFGKEWISQGEPITFPSKEGKEVHAFYYPPQSPHYQGTLAEKPPLIVKAHGGPTSRSYNSLSLEIQYWTSRGFALVDVNYSGSTGFGREYAKRLEEKWGILDVEDCIGATQYLVAKGLADPQRLLIRGGSAGGYTTLASLAFHHVFAAGTSYYGISDLKLLLQETHKFEATYLYRLIGKPPELEKRIVEYSPIYHVNDISSPVLLIQGEEDLIVPVSQSIRIYEALCENQVPTALLLFQGEGHGFKKASSKKKALETELFFYCQVLGIDRAKEFDPPPLEIVGLG